MLRHNASLQPKIKPRDGTTDEVSAPAFTNALPVLNILLKDEEVTERTVVVQKLSAFGVKGFPNGPLELRIRATSHASGDIHTISVHFVAQLCGHDFGFLLDLASTGECFFQMEWIFPDHKHPKFTTRHVLVVAIENADVSFGGGFDSFLKLLNHFQSFRKASAHRPHVASAPYFPRHQDFRQNQPFPMRVGSGSTVSLAHRTWPEAGDFPLGIPSGLPDTPVSMSPLPVGDDQVSVCSDLTATTAFYQDSNTASSSAHDEFPSDWHCDALGEYIDHLGSPEPLIEITESTGFAAQYWGANVLSDDEWIDQQVQRQIQTEILQQHQRDADALFAKNGDTSGFIAVQNWAAEYAQSWQPLGLPFT